MASILHLTLGMLIEETNNMTETIHTQSNVKNINESPGVQDSRRAVSQPGSKPESDSHFLELANTLQCTLELGKLLELYDDEINALIPHDGFRYENYAEKFQFELGKTELHHCNYKLVLLQENLGLISFYRSNKFTKMEIDKLEALVAALIYPLRNSILYKRALETAYRDPITNLNNRAAMDNTLTQELDYAGRHDLSLSVLMLDLDKFKDVNDTYGHIAGDNVLKHVADCLTECARRSDVLFRYGGEEFVVILRNTSKSGAKLLAGRIRESVEKIQCNYRAYTIRTTVSIGVAMFRNGDNNRSILERADNALYKAKSEGRNRVVLSD